jgi:hypothetical protein
MKTTVNGSDTENMEKTTTNLAHDPVIGEEPEIVGSQIQGTLSSAHSRLLMYSYGDTWLWDSRSAF